MNARITSVGRAATLAIPSFFVSLSFHIYSLFLLFIVLIVLIVYSLRTSSVKPRVDIVRENGAASTTLLQLTKSLSLSPLLCRRRSVYSG